MQAMRATYQLNTEKLEYNYRVLVERDHENQATINQQKRKISRQRDILSSLKTRYLETDRKYMEENMRLTDEYKRITEQFKDLQGKFRHFELVDTKKYTEERLRDPRSYGALSLLVDEAGFLTDAKAKAVMEKLPKDEAGLVAAESIVRALGVVDGISFDTLMDALSADSNIEVKAKGLGGLRMPVDDGVGRQGGGEAGHSSVLVHPDDAVKRLKAFVEVENTAPARSGLAGPSRATGAMRRAAELEQEFWTRMAHVISDKGARVWRALDKQLQRYHGLLQTRANNLADVDSLQNQNDELRALLNQYLGSRINEELEIPPTQII
ncbi:sperm tail C-terminal domain-containing protein [Dunaliella salina]|uniref:Sperm tail C-terminal domain-containing protein n=1 Tax=Dunaliella salina TaxID=3046 RepID=A0ABQ7GD65_DUNSA|nr:sperm tail C-terminal domain-containing protein [Dunaliella salina]|eukprot:KAF5832552.1 sperm tail C-terminal domain-containing protein [Dunaliella salina]